MPWKNLGKDDYCVLDVREDFEVAEGILDGAIHIPINEITKRYKELDPSKKIFIYCATGVRAERAIYLLLDKGYTVENIGAYKQWVK